MEFERPFTLNRGLSHIRVHELATMLAVSYPKVFPSFVLGRIGNALVKEFTPPLGFMLLCIVMLVWGGSPVTKHGKEYANSTLFFFFRFLILF